MANPPPSSNNGSGNTPPISVPPVTGDGGTRGNDGPILSNQPPSTTMNNSNSSTGSLSSSDFSTRSIFGSLSSRADILSDDQLDPDKLKDIKVNATRGDCLNNDELKLFESSLKKFCKMVVKSDPSESHFAAFVLSVVQASLNQSTSTKNERLKHLINTFSVAGTEYTWTTSNLISFLRGVFPRIQNPLRRYLRTIEDQISIMKATGMIDSDGHLAAKHGTVSQYWNTTSDFTNGSKSNISDDDLAANYLQKASATRSKKKERQIFNVSQLTGAID